MKLLFGQLEDKFNDVAILEYTATEKKTGFHFGIFMFCEPVSQTSNQL